MVRTRLPDTDLEVSALCLGGGGFGSRLVGVAADRLLGAFLEAGGNFVDSAHCYAFWEPGGAGCSERELGASLRRIGAWGEVIIGTKGGHPEHGPQYPRPDRYLAPELIAADISDSLRNLDCEQIDLYYLHRDDPRVPAAEIIDALNEEVRQGRLRYLGASNWSTERIAAANEHAARTGQQGFVVSQLHWSLAEPSWHAGPDPTTRTVTPEDARWYEEQRLPIVAYSATANGYFSRETASSYDTPENEERRRRARHLATELGCTAAQVGLAYLRHAGPQTIPLFSTTRPGHLAEAVGSLAVTLTPEQCGWLVSG